VAWRRLIPTRPTKAGEDVLMRWGHGSRTAKVERIRSVGTFMVDAIDPTAGRHQHPSIKEARKDELVLLYNWKQNEDE
jgi:hypothetical protein